MEYHADVVAGNMTIQTSHHQGVNSFKKQVALLLGITLLDAEQHVTEDAKHMANLFSIFC